MATPGFLHTSSAHVPTFESLLAELMPGSTALHLVDESLLADARRDGPESVAGRVAERLDELVQQGAGIICCTCSSIGEVAERLESPVPVFRLDRPMAERAVLLGGRVGILVTVTSTIEPTRRLVEAAARRLECRVGTTVAVADGAWDLFESGDRDGSLDACADAARRMAPEVDVIVLAQASMTGTEDRLTDLGIPVLSSPRLAVEHLARQLG